MDVSSTPLDLLLNAITGKDGPQGEEGGDIGLGQEDLFNDPVYDFSGLGEGSINRQQQSLDQVKDEQIRRAITQLVLETSAPTRGKTSSIQVWHPTAAQKSYNKERRLIAPPPFVRISGPILGSITTLTLSSVPIPINAETANPSSSQTHRILGPGASGLLTEDPNAPPRVIKKQGRDQRGPPKPQFGRNLPLSLSAKSEVQFDKNREMLGEGVTFPGLWIGGGEAEVKIKGFRLVLDIAAGAETTLPTAAPGPGDLDMTGTSFNGIDQNLADAATPTAPSSGIPQPWAKLSSSPISIVTKPSIKTAKSRSLVSCLTDTAAFALWVRIHAQAVRTKYMKLDDNTSNARLTSRTGQWTPFTFEIIHRALLASEHITMQKAVGEEARRVMTYGSIVRLIDTKSGTKSEAVKLVKVEKNEVVIGIYDEEEEEIDAAASGDGQPISELQRIGMVRINDQGEEVLEDGKRSYLSAPGARLGGGEMVDPNSEKWIWVGRGRRVPTKPKSAQNPSTPVPGPSTPLPQTLDDVGIDGMAEDIATALGIPESAEVEDTISTPVVETQAETQEEKADADDGERPAKRIKTKRHALAAAAVAEEEDVEQIVCTWSVANRRMSEREEKVGKATTKKQVRVEVIEDWMAWVIGGVECFTHTFTDAEAVSNDPLPVRKPIIPAPRLLLDPVFDPTNNTLQLSLSSFFTLPTPLSRPAPLSVYLGPVGPLSATIWQSTWRSTSVKHPTRGPAVPCLSFNGEDAFPSDNDEAVLSTFPAIEEHVIVLVKMPRPAETFRIMQILQMQATVNSTDPNPTADIPSTNAIAGPSEDPPAWLDVGTGFDPAEMDGNEAIRQALQSVSQATEEEAEFSASLNRLDSVQDGEINIDPTLQSSIGSGSKLRVQVARRDQTQQRQIDEQTSLGSEMIPLPILLVRREGEMIFGLGKSVVAEKRSEAGDDWGLRVISS